MNSPRREWQGSLVAFGWVLVVTLGYRLRDDVHSAAVSVSWTRRRVEGEMDEALSYAATLLMWREAIK